MAARILIAGIGNIFFGDDAFGVELARRLSERTLPDGVEVIDFGIRGIDLAYALLDDYAVAILLDATARGEAPGTLYLIEPDTETLGGLGLAGVEMHNVDPVQVLATVEAFGGRPPRLWLVGCEPDSFEARDNNVVSLSAPVKAALPGAIEMVEALVARILREARSTGTAEPSFDTAADS